MTPERSFLSSFFIQLSCPAVMDDCLKLSEAQVLAAPALAYALSPRPRPQARERLRRSGQSRSTCRATWSACGLRARSPWSWARPRAGAWRANALRQQSECGEKRRRRRATRSLGAEPRWTAPSRGVPWVGGASTRQAFTEKGVFLRERGKNMRATRKSANEARMGAGGPD